MMAKVPPGRSTRCASAIMFLVAARGSSCMTKQQDTRSTVSDGNPVASPAACTNLHHYMHK